MMVNKGKCNSNKSAINESWWGFFSNQEVKGTETILIYIHLQTFHKTITQNTLFSLESRGFVEIIKMVLMK
jgi:hypothetical protein